MRPKKNPHITAITNNVHEAERAHSCCRLRAHSRHGVRLGPVVRRSVVDVPCVSWREGPSRTRRRRRRWARSRPPRWLIQLYLFREKRRQNEIMAEMAKTMTDADLQKYGRRDRQAGRRPSRPPIHPMPPAWSAAGHWPSRTTCNSCHKPRLFRSRQTFQGSLPSARTTCSRRWRDYKFGHAARLRSADGRGAGAGDRRADRRSGLLRGPRAVTGRLCPARGTATLRSGLVIG